MAFSVAVAGSSLVWIDSSGTATSLTLPTGVTVVTGTPARFAIVGRNVIIANCVTSPIWVDPDGNVRRLSLAPPAFAPTLAAGSAGNLTGAYMGKYTFIIKDGDGNLIFETEPSPVSEPVTLAAKQANWSGISASGESAVTGRRFYRTSSSGDEFFQAFDLDDNVTTSYVDDVPDESLDIVPISDELATAPEQIELIREWKGFAFAKSRDDVDAVYATAQGKLYAWPTRIVVPPVGRDRFGVTSLIVRRDELGLCRRDVVYKITGSDEDTFEVVKVVEGKGSVCDDATLVIRDVGYFLGDDGYYSWDSDGVRSISDEKVKPWFTTDDTFNRSAFPNAFAAYCPRNHSIRLFLAAAGGSTINRWVEYFIEEKKWLGPHLTTELTPTAAGLIYDSNELLLPVVCSSSGYVYKDTPGTYNDGASEKVKIDVIGKFHDGGEPDDTHVWLELSMFAKINSGGGTLTITPKVGDLDASAGATIAYTLTAFRRRLRRLGVGRLCQLQFTDDQLNTGVEIYGYEIPYFTVGRR